MLNGAELPLVSTIVDGPKNYTISINSSFVAWPTALFTDVDQAWLYVDVNRATAALTYGIVKVEPAYGPTAPATPTDGALWFNTTKLENLVYNASANRWFPVLRVVLGHYTTTSLNEVAFGSQVGLSGSTVTSGQIVSDGFGRALTDSSGRFFTTEDVVLISGVESHAAKLESNVIMGSAAEPIPAFHVVRFNNTGDIELADYDDVGDSVIGLAVVSGVQGNPINLVLSGLVYNPAWTFSGPNITLWVNQTGQLTAVDPFDQGSRAKRRVPVGRTIDSHTIIFDQGMGGVGEKGEAGAVDGIPVASGTVVGITRLSVNPEDPAAPIAVGDNDPRLTDPRVPLEHTHPATSITVSPFGTFNGTNAQQALEHVQTVKLNLSGGTVTGPIVSTVQATQDTHLVTLGQAKSEITARAVTERRYTLADEFVTVVQAFNALSPAQRTLAVNTVVVVEWRGDMYMWAGGYGTPVSATDSAQFLLIGRLIIDTPPLTFKTIQAYTVYEGEAPPPESDSHKVLVIFEGSTTGLFDTLTGTVTPVTLPAITLGSNTVGMARSPVNANLAISITNGEGQSIAILDSTTFAVVGRIDEYAPGFPINEAGQPSAAGPIRYSPDGTVIAFAHRGLGESVNTKVTLCDTTTLEPLRTLDMGTDTSGTYEFTDFAFSSSGEQVMVVLNTAATKRATVFNVSDGSVLRTYENAGITQVAAMADNQLMVSVIENGDLPDGLYVISATTPPASLPVTPFTALQSAIRPLQLVRVSTATADHMLIIAANTAPEAPNQGTRFMRVDLTSGILETIDVPADVGVWMMSLSPLGTDLGMINYDNSNDIVTTFDPINLTLSMVTFTPVGPAYATALLYI